MKILHLITRMDRGGSAVNTLLSATGQLQAGHEVVLAMGPSVESEMSPEEAAVTERSLAKFTQAGGTIQVLPALFRRPSPIHDLRAFFQIRKLLSGKFDVVHTHTSKAGALGRLAAWGRAKSIVHTSHGHVFHGYYGWLATKFFILAERFLALRCHALVALTPQERDDHLALNVGKPSQWHVVHSGVDIKAIASGTDSADAEKTWRAVSVGRLVSIKGMDRLIRAWREVVDRDASARLAIIGDGPELPALQELSEGLGLGNHIHFTGWTEPLPYLRSAKSFVLLSRNEGMGRAVVEAMAVGLPCVVADVCGLRELVDDRVGRRVDADSPSEVAEALCHSWPLEVSEAACQKAFSYSVEVMVDKLMRLYEGLLESK